MAALSYATVGSNRLEEAKAFYDALLGSIGLSPLMDHPSGGRVYGKEGRPVFAVLGPYNKEPATAGNGAMCGFTFDSPAEAMAFHEKAIELGGTDEGAPGERAPGFYGGYFRDIEGNKFAGFHMA